MHYFVCIVAKDYTCKALQNEHGHALRKVFAMIRVRTLLQAEVGFLQAYLTCGEDSSVIMHEGSRVGRPRHGVEGEK